MINVHTLIALIIVLSLYYHCTIIFVLSLYYYHCTIIVLSLYYHYIIIILTPAGVGNPIFIFPVEAGPAKQVSAGHLSLSLRVDRSLDPVAADGSLDPVAADGSLDP